MSSCNVLPGSCWWEGNGQGEGSVPTSYWVCMKANVWQDLQELASAATVVSTHQGPCVESIVGGDAIFRRHSLG